jgi:hypothetical protein
MTGRDLAPSGRISRRLLPALALGAVLLGHAFTPRMAVADSVALVWTAPGDDGNVGRASSYEMRYSENPVLADTAAWWAAATSVGPMPVPLPAGSRESFIVAGLAPGKTLYFAIRTADEIPNVSGFSSIAVKQSSAGSIPLATVDNFAAEVSSDAVLLSWSQVASGGSELGYRLYRKADADPASTLLATLPLSAAAWSDTTVSAGAGYNFSIATYDNSGEGTKATLRAVVPSAAAAQPVVHGFPNPARDKVTFKVSVKSTSEQPTRVTVFDLNGHRICVLANEVLTPGDHAMSWLCMSDAGNKVAPGLYNVIVEGPSGRAVTRVAIVP